MIDWINCGIVPNRMSRFCTKYLKIVPMQRYIESLGIIDYDTVMGIRYDEPQRVLKHPDAILPLVAGRVTQKIVREWWSKQPFDLQLKDYEGNCDLCQLKSLRKRLTIIREHPDFAEWWSEMEKRTQSEFQQGMSVEKLIEKSQRSFQLAIDGREMDLNNPSLFGDDLEVSCFCGD